MRSGPWTRGQADDGPGRDVRLAWPRLVPRFEAVSDGLRKLGHPIEAGWLLVALVEAELRRGGELAPEARRLALRAAELFDAGRARLLAARLAAAAGDVSGAARLLREGGEEEAARALLEEAPRRVPLGDAMVGVRDPGRAATEPAMVRQGAAAALARVAAHGRLDVARALALALELPEPTSPALAGAQARVQEAEGLARKGRLLDAASAWRAAEQPERALAELCRVPHGDPDWREACRQAVELAVQLDHLGFELDHLVAPWIRSGPTSPRERDAFASLAELYRDHAQPEAARETLEAALRAFPADPVLAAACAALPPRPALAPRTSAPLPDLPDLPDLPPLPPPPSARGASPSPPGPSPTPPRRPRPDDDDGATIVPDSLDSILPAGDGARATTAPQVTAWGRSRVEAGPRRSQVPRAARPGVPAPTGDARVVFAPGQVVAERYRIDAELGEGGMGTVFQAWDLELHEAVALKVLTVPVHSEKLVERFRRELRLARRLTHDNVVRVHDLGLYQGWRYISMELLSGADLSHRLRSGPPPLAMAVDLVCQAAEGLFAAHQQGVVHRDVKSANLFLTDEGRVKVMDFGLAASQQVEGALRMTHAGTVAGSPAYMAPEQGSSLDRATAQSDQYSLGVVAYELLTGGLPFEHPELLPLLRLHAEAPVPSLRGRDPAIPAALEAAVLRALQKAPQDRHTDCRAFAQALRATVAPR